MKNKSLIVAAALAMALFNLLPCHADVSANTPFYYRQEEAGKPLVHECEVAVYGGTPAGVTAAIEASRMGRKTLLISFNRHVGGLTSGGLTASDLGKKESIDGLALDFYTRLGGTTDFKASAADPSCTEGQAFC